MSEPLKRRSLTGILDTPPPAMPEAVIAATGARNGFAAVTPAETQDNAAAAGARRRRQPTGRVHQFNVRLRADTLEDIYSQANGRNVPVAQVIEEAMAALAQQARA